MTNTHEAFDPIGVVNEEEGKVTFTLSEELLDEFEYVIKV